MTLELGTETLTDSQNLLASKDLTRPGPSVKYMRPINDMSNSVASRDTGENMDRYIAFSE